jgi:hypothetical protein
MVSIRGGLEGLSEEEEGERRGRRRGVESRRGRRTGRGSKVLLLDLAIDEDDLDFTFEGDSEGGDGLFVDDSDLVGGGGGGGEGVREERAFGKKGLAPDVLFEASGRRS